MPEIGKIAIGDIKPYKKNARTHSPEQIEKLRASLREFGFVNPVLIDKENNLIAGHGRIEAARLEGMAAVPYYRVEHLTGVQRRAYILADNRLAELAGWDDAVLKMELDGLREAGFDVGVLAFDPPEEYDYTDFEEESNALEGMEEVTLTVTIPARCRDSANEWLRNGEPDTAIGRGRGVLKRCGLR